MKTRIMVAIVCLPVLLLILLVLPAIATGILIAAMSVAAVYELMFKTGMVKDIRLCFLSAICALFVSLWSCGQREWAPVLAAIWIFVMILGGLMIASKAALRFEHICVSAFAGFILPLMLSSLTRILTMDYGRFYVLLPLILSFGTDSAAYFVGVFFGKHKMAPVISPKKSWEGAVGGVLGGIVLMVLYALVLDLGFKFEVQYGLAALYGILGAVTCVLGDLYFSAIKRQTGVKDFGTILPGHGGILDRFDSMTVVGMLTEVLLLMFPLISR